MIKKKETHYNMRVYLSPDKFLVKPAPHNLVVAVYFQKRIFFLENKKETHFGIKGFRVYFVFVMRRERGEALADAPPRVVRGLLVGIPDIADGSCQNDWQMRD